MKAALKRRSAVMDGKTCGRRKSRKKCAENKPWEEEDRMGTGPSWGKRGWSGSAAPTAEELLYESSLKERVHACFLSPAENSPLLPSPLFYRSA